MAVVSLSLVVVPWPGTAAPRPRKHSEGQAHVGAGSAAPDPRSVCVWWLFSECEVVSFVLHFSVIFSAAEIPRGQSQERGHGAEDPVALHTGALGPLLLEVRDTAGHKSHARRGGARCRRERARGTFPSPPRTLSFSLDTHPCPGGDCCAVGHGQREQLHVPCAQVCMILCKLTANS